MGDVKKAAAKAKTEGGKNIAAGAIKEGASKLTGNKSGEMEGKAQKAAGKVQHKAGKAADKAADEARGRL